MATDQPSTIQGSGKVVRIGGAIGLRMEAGFIWYPHNDLEDYDGERVRVTIERLDPKPQTQKIGFRAPEPKQPASRSRKR